MILADTLMQKIADWQPPHSPRPVFNHSEPSSGVAIRVEFVQIDRLSGRIWEVSATRGRSALADAAALAEWARQTAGRVTGLLERLRLIEIDDHLGKAMLRSAAPARKKAARFYHEVILCSDGSATVRRYRGSCEAPGREQVPFAITHEALAKLVGDIVE